ncbi:RHS repeat-associated core domain-containing protein [Streptomyces sp. PRB2-1]|uniref:RHS repeat-associated core domain-containing protein n=1 Tax=Actinacidiphila epipremni TaxID=2053013 RepID=A0ABX0ZHT2_9ACTN|nr:RHS repeat-associated core domain-containing protein [Actinacidiphila epipremni]
MTLHRTPAVRHRTPAVRHRAPGVRHRAAGTRHRAPGVRPRRLVALLSGALLAAGTLQAVPAAAHAAGGHAPAAAAATAGRSVPGSALPHTARPPDPEAGPAPALARPAWPAARSGALTVGGGEPVALPGTGLAVTAAHGAQLAVRTLDQDTVRALGGVGYAFTASVPGGARAAAPQPVTVRLDYAAFRQAAGGGFADRLRLERLPGCVLARPACAARPVVVPARNDPAGATITADGVQPDGDVYVLASTASGSSGDYRATDLKPSGKWSVGPQSGDFTYSYPLPLPPSPYGKAPALALGYSAQSVDGRTSATNNQASWAGLGWSLEPGFIERKYRACVDDGSPTLSDLCWYSPYSSAEEGAEYVISLNGTTTELIRDADGGYHAEADPGWKIQHTYDGTNSDNSKEAWVVSTPDGSRYYFGYHEDSNLTVPVVGNNSGEPCHDSGQSLCRQTYRWNLDQIRDPDENDTRLYWTKETNSYKRFSNGDVETYDRGSYPSRVEYGMQAGQQPAVRVDFTSAYRCLSDIDKPSPDCAAPTSSAGSDYPDVPADLICGSTCTKNSPSFFVVRRLAAISTQVWDPATSAFMEVDRIQPTFALPDPVGATDAMLWLNYLQVYGKWGDNVTLPAVDFDGAWLNNRVDHPSGDTTAAMPMRRITSVQNGLGGETDVHYGHGSPAATCPSDGSTSTWESGKHWDTNTQECFRVDYKPEGATSTTHGVFQKYVVTGVDQVDLVGGSPTQTTTYDYLGDPAWHYDDDPTAPADRQMWGDWRGYQDVRQTDGTGPEGQRTVTETTRFRGMDGDRLASGGTKSVTLTDWAGNTFADNHAKAGQVLQVRHFRLDGSGTSGTSRTELADERYTYWDSGITANGAGLHNAHMIRPYQTRARQLKADGTWRETGSDQDGYSAANGGLPTRKVQWGEIGTGADNTCTEIDYARNTDDWRWMLDYPERTELHSGDPDPQSTQCPGPAVSRTVTLYDNATAPGTADKPIDGNPTEVRTYWNDTNYASQKKAYDGYGRVTSDTDGLNHTTTTSYTPASGWPMNGTRTTDPLGRATTTYTSRAFGTTTRTVDPNGLATTTDYDGAGRVERVWLPTEPKPNGVDVPPPAGAVPSYTYTYHFTLGGTAPNSQPSKPTVVTAEQLQSLDAGTPTWLPTYTYLDGFGRTREVQTPSPSGSGGRTVTDTTYDERGLAKGTSAPYWNSTAPGDDPGLFLNPQRAELPSWTEKTYDALGRESAATLYTLGQAQWTTATANYGDGKVVTPPRGGRTAYWNDGLDRTALVEENVPAGTDVPPPTVPTTRYTYTPRGELAGITDAAGNATAYGYDWMGRRTSTKDPDAGASSTVYDPVGNVQSTTDAAGNTLAYTYDALNRKRVEWSGSVGGVKLAEWTYDTVPFPGQTGTPVKFVLGQPAGTTRYVDGRPYRVDVTGYDLRYQVTARTWTVPADEGFAAAYSVGYGYDRAGHRTSVSYPAAGDLPAETVTTGYSAAGQPDTLTGPAATYVKSTTYSGAGQLMARAYGGDGAVQRAYAYEAGGAQRLTGIRTLVGTGADAGAGTVTVQNDLYGYDQASNLTSVTDLTQAPAQNQCYQYDALQRLGAAWTTAAGCANGLSGADTSGPDPYRLAYTYDAVGDMASVADAAGTVTYTYPAPGPAAIRPHAVSAVGADSYGYDADGRLTSRTVAGTPATLAWDDAGELASVSAAGGARTSFAYDADADRLLRRDAGGTTLYLDGTELRASGGAVSAVRYYTAGTAVVAMRTGGGVVWLGSDQQNSTQVAIGAGAGAGVGDGAGDGDGAGAGVGAGGGAEGGVGAVSRQRYLPYGAHRGAGDALPATDRGFLGKTEDADTGLVQAGARYYDPSTGRFISPDPQYDTSEPKSLNPYAYAEDNPTTLSDPSGLSACGHACDSNATSLDLYAGGTSDNSSSVTRSYWGGHTEEEVATTATMCGNCSRAEQNRMRRAPDWSDAYVKQMADDPAKEPACTPSLLFPRCVNVPSPQQPGGCGLVCLPAPHLPEVRLPRIPAHCTWFGFCQVNAPKKISDPISRFVSRHGNLITAAGGGAAAIGCAALTDSAVGAATCGAAGALWTGYLVDKWAPASGQGRCIGLGVLVPPPGSPPIATSRSC